MVRVVAGGRERIKEYAGCLFERDPVFPEVSVGFPTIPCEAHLSIYLLISILCLRGRRGYASLWLVCFDDNEPMKPIAEEHSLWKLIGLALVSTRGTKLRYWKQFFMTLRARLVASRA